MLGRVTALEFASAMLLEAMSAYFAGIAQDNFHLSPQQSSIILAVVAGIIFSAWYIWYHRHIYELKDPHPYPHVIKTYSNMEQFPTPPSPISYGAVEKDPMMI